MRPLPAPTPEYRALLARYGVPSERVEAVVPGRVVDEDEVQVVLVQDGPMTLDDELDLILARRDRTDMQPTLDALLPILAAHPQNARVLYEVAGAYDTAGQEDQARPLYEDALAAGLDGDLLMRCFVQYGSTLRNLGELEASREVFARARAAFPESPSLGVFEAITLHAQGRPHEAVASLLELLAEAVHTPDIARYTAAIRANAQFIRSLDDHPTTA